MILEKLEEVRALSPEEKVILAGELWREAADNSVIDVNPALTELLRQRLREYHANPDAVSSWEDVKARLLGVHAQ